MISARAIILASLFFLLSIGFAYSTYHWIDMSISYTYLNDSYEAEARSKTILVDLLKSELEGTNKREVVEKLEAYKNKHLTKNILLKEEKDSGNIAFEDLTFIFSNENLIGIE